MRSVYIVLVTLLLVGAGFALYSWVQPARTGKLIAPTFSGAPATAPAGSPANLSIPVSRGENVYLESYDAKKGYLTRRFRAASYNPRSDGTVDVVKPEAEFYSENGQMMRVRGNTGEIVVPSNGTGTEAMAHPPMPTRGKLYDVTLTLFPPGAHRPTITCNVPNVVFDNDTFIIQTDAFKDAKSNEIAADQVPVSMRGDDYDFDGRGLTIHWDERNRRLARLEIAHGHSLIIKHPKTLGIATSQPATQPVLQTAAQPTPQHAQTGGVDSSTLRRAPRRGGSTKPAADPTSAPATQETPEGDPYRAEFHDFVRVVQGSEQLAECQLMNVDFLMGAREPTTQPTAAPTTPAPRQPAHWPATSAAEGHASVAPVAPPASPSATEQPIVILWTGKLIVSPTPEDTAHPQGKDAIIEMLSADRQVIARREGSEVKCSSLRLHTVDDSLFLRNSEKFPQITIKDANGVSVVSRSFDYSGESHIALVRGTSHAEFPITENSHATTAPTTKPTQIARVDWTKTCTLYMANSDKHEQMTIEKAMLRGDVKIDHPQMKLDANALDLTFDPNPLAASRTTPTADPAHRATENASLKHMLATDNVRGRFTDADNPTNPPQTIDCETLDVAFERAPDGHSAPKLAVADGNVISGDGKSELRAGHLEVTMSPATQPTTAPLNAPATQPAGNRADLPRVQVEKLFAQQDVHAISMDGKDIRCDELDMKQTESGPLYTLRGTTSSPARAGDATNTLIGQIIKFAPNTQKALVEGPGSMHGVQQSKSTTKPSTQPIDVTWEKGLDADGRTNLVNIAGNVVATSKLDDGSVNVVQGSHMTITLTDAPPATQPTTQPGNSPTTKPTTRKSSTRPAGADALGGGDANAFHDKLVQSATVECISPDNAEVRSTLLAANGSLLRRLHLFASTLRYEASPKRMVVPVPGRMLYEDNRGAPATQPAPAKENPQAMQITLRGATAFQWQKDFIYDDAAHQATMSGNVDVVHKGNAPNEAFRLNANHVMALLDPTEAKSASDSGTKLRRVIAEGDVNFVAQRLQFLAQRIEYDPVTQDLVARGTPSQPATLLDANGLSQGTFTELQYNAKTDRLKFVDFRAAMRRTGS